MGLEGLDRWITGNWGEDSVQSAYCPHCLAEVDALPEEDEVYCLCPECGETYGPEEALSEYEYRQECQDRRDSERENEMSDEV